MVLEVARQLRRAGARQVGRRRDRVVPRSRRDLVPGDELGAGRAHGVTRGVGGRGTRIQDVRERERAALVDPEVLQPGDEGRQRVVL